MLDISGLIGGAAGENLLFATGRSKVHLLRVAKAVKFELKHRGVLINGVPPSIEGSAADDWMVVDGGAVVVSVMEGQMRERLALEQHWEDQGARRVELPPADDDDEAAAAAAAATRQAAAAAATSAAAGPVPSAVDDDVYREVGGDDEAALLAAEEAGEFDDLDEYAGYLDGYEDEEYDEEPVGGEGAVAVMDEEYEEASDDDEYYLDEYYDEEGYQDAYGDADDYEDDYYYDEDDDDDDEESSGPGRGKDRKDGQR